MGWSDFDIGSKVEMTMFSTISFIILIVEVLQIRSEMSRLRNNALDAPQKDSAINQLLRRMCLSCSILMLLLLFKIPGNGKPYKVIVSLAFNNMSAIVTCAGCLICYMIFVDQWSVVAERNINHVRIGRILVLTSVVGTLLVGNLMVIISVAIDRAWPNAIFLFWLAVVMLAVMLCVWEFSYRLHTRLVGQDGQVDPIIQTFIRFWCFITVVAVLTASFQVYRGVMYIKNLDAVYYDNPNEPLYQWTFNPFTYALLVVCCAGGYYSYSPPMCGLLTSEDVLLAGHNSQYSSISGR